MLISARGAVRSAASSPPPTGPARLGRTVTAAPRRRPQMSARDRARARARALARDPVPVHDLARASAVARELASDLAGARARALALASASGLDPSFWRKPAGVRPTPTASRLLVAAVRLLPTGDRTRYGEEYQSELSEIAESGASRRRQLLYAGRQVRSAWHLRVELWAPRRQGAAP